MTHLVVLKPGEKRVFAIENTRARRDMVRDLIDGIRFVRLPRSQVWFRIHYQFGQIGLIERFDARGERGSAKNENGCAVFARDASRFNCDVKTIFHTRRGEHDPRAVAVTAKDGLMQIALLYVSGQACAGTAALNIET